MAAQTVNGKAFEYACLNALRKRLDNDNKRNSTIRNKAYEKAESSYDSLDHDQQESLDKAANTAIKLILPLEPRIENGDGILILGLNEDSAAIGVDGDVRDVLCIRHGDDWEIGLSCKHNHAALKHPRITEKKDFGMDWVGYHCSSAFIAEMSLVIDPLIRLGNNNTLWTSIPDKKQTYYVPILKAYVEEIKRLCNQHNDVPAKLLSYFFGSKDFYKVIAKEQPQITEIEGFNMSGTLNAPAKNVRSITKVKKLTMPSRLIEARFKTNSDTTIILTFDGGWSISMRLHNKDKIARPTSLAWDVQLEGLPTGIYINQRSWNE